jgi:hypothetical protein
VYKAGSTAAHFPVADDDVISSLFPDLRRCLAISLLPTGALESRCGAVLAIIRSVDIKTV